MELVSVLNKPYTIIQRADFVVNNNRNLGYEIREFDDRIEALGLTEEEKQEQEQKQAIESEISELKEYLNRTDYIYARCTETGEDVEELYSEVIAARKAARTRIQELEG